MVTIVMVYTRAGKELTTKAALDKRGFYPRKRGIFVPCKVSDYFINFQEIGLFFLPKLQLCINMRNFHTNNCFKTDGAYNHFTMETNRNLTENTEILWVKLMISVFSGCFRLFSL